MFSFWKIRAKASAYQTLVSGKHRPAVAMQVETFLARAKRLDTNGSRRRLRQVAEENRLI